MGRVYGSGDGSRWGYCLETPYVPILVYHIVALTIPNEILKRDVQHALCIE